MKKRIISYVLAAALLAAIYAPVQVNAVYFQDTSAHWASDIIDRWSSNGIIEGESSDQFFPDEYITRADLALIISRVMGYKEESLSAFKDLDGLEAEKKSAILKLNKAGIMLGSNGYMRPYDYISREETAVMFGRMLRIDNNPSGEAHFSDMHTVSSWAYGIVSVMGSKGYMRGRTNGMFDPKNNITRAEVIQILENIVNGYYGKSGSYSVSTLGNVVIGSSNVELRQVAITGDLFITEAVGSGTVTLTDVTVKGNVYIMGGSGLKLVGNTRLPNLYHEKTGSSVFKYNVYPPASLENLYVNIVDSAPILYEGPLKSMYLSDANQPVQMKSATVGNLFINAPGISLTADENTSINTASVNFLFQMLGGGIITSANIAEAANGTSFERQPKSVVLPSGTTVFMAGQTFYNKTNKTQTIIAVEDNIPPTVNNASLTALNLTSDGVTFSWKAATDNVSNEKTLRYALYYSTSPYMYTVPYIETNGTMLTNYTSGKLTATVSGLTSGQVYYFNIIVKDQADNKSCYAAFTLKIGKDIEPPVPGNMVISKSNIKASEVTLSWEKASDTVTEQSKLVYTLYQSESNNIGTVADCEKNGKAVMKAAADTNTYRVTGLKQTLSYYFNVVVADEAGNKACYQMTSLGKDNSPPQADSYVIRTSNLKGTEVTLSWTKAVDDLTEQSKLKYTVYISELNNINTVSECEQNGRVLMKSAANKDTYRATGLTELSLYYFNVIVQDEAGNKTCYSAVSVTPVKDTIEPTVPANANITVASTSINSARLTWSPSSDNVTPASSLKYSVYYSSSPNIRTVAEITKNGKALLTPTAGRLFFDFIQPGDSTGTNYLNVLVEDEAGNKSCYNILLLRLGEDNDPPDLPEDAAVKLTGWSKTTASLSWLASNDLTGGRIGSAASELSYAVYYMPASGNIADFDEISEIENRSVWNSEFSRNTLSMTVTGLTENSRYFFNVVVKDKAGHKNCYLPVLVITDDVPPDVSASTIEVVSEPDNERSLRISWGRAQDTYTAQEKLKYALYYSVNKEYTSIEDIEKYGRPLPDSTTVYLPYDTGRSLNGIYYETPYYFYVLVVDEAGNRAKYMTKQYVLEDTAPPVISDPTVTPGETVYDAATDTFMIRMSWTLASDEVSTGALLYSIYVSTEEYSTLDQLLSSGRSVLSQGRDMEYFDHSGQSAGIYYYYVVVEDDAGNRAMYLPCRVVISPN